jgi:PAS domain S-box-containing protein
VSAPVSLIQVGLVGEAVENGPVGVLVADENMRYIAANDYVCNLLGYERSELLELKVTDIARWDDARAEYADLVRDGVRSGSGPLTRKDGSTLRARYRASQTTVAGMLLYVSVLWPDE